MRYLIFLDIDGTLLTRHGVAARTLAAIRRATDEGHLVFINTGRSKGNVPFSALADVPLTGIVAGLGAYIEMEGRVLFSHAMSIEEISLTMQAADEIGTGLVLEGEQMLIDYRPARLDPRWLADRPSVESIRELVAHYPTLRVSKISVTKPLPDNAIKQLSPHLNVINQPTYAEISSKGLSKATAIEFLKERFDIDNDHVIAMGDSLNDVDMLRAAGIAVVMGDGHPDIKPLADFISTAAHEGGVGQAIEELVLKKQA